MSSLYEELATERARIVRFERRECPRDFPPELRRLWHGTLEYSLTPHQTGWAILAAEKRLRSMTNRSNKH